MPENISIAEIEINGFKSIKRLPALSLNRLNLLIGANGSGKTSFVSFFKMVQFYLGSLNGLSEYVGQNGGAEFLLHFGSRHTDTISAKFKIKTGAGINEYQVELGTSIGDTLYFKDEKVCFSANRLKEKNKPLPLGGGGKESRLHQIREDDAEYNTAHKTIRSIKRLMGEPRFYQFHNTSKDAYIRKSSQVEDNRYLRSDGGNLSSFLYMLKEDYPDSYKTILEITGRIAPYIESIRLENEYNPRYVKLNWTEAGYGDYSFDVGQMSDGTLRAMALITLLVQPNPPRIICIDEPELGLHPEAIAILGDLLKCASEKSQIIVSTQSPALVDLFEPEDIIVVNRVQGESRFERLDPQKYSAWLEEYSLSQMWNANVFGGRP
ncbi:MAG: AAA family ATPase [Peptococcaceae bacterium]|jgi:predicted ATPase|nr:AAA family ATPase [Peptococcaceae bacterium]